MLVNKKVQVPFWGILDLREAYLWTKIVRVCILPPLLKQEVAMLLWNLTCVSETMPRSAPRSASSYCISSFRLRNSFSFLHSYNIVRKDVIRLWYLSVCKIDINSMLGFQVALLYLRLHSKWAETYVLKTIAMALWRWITWWCMTVYHINMLQTARPHFGKKCEF